MVEQLSDPQIEESLAKLDGWARCAGRHAIYKRFTFRDFRAAFAFMTRVALISEARDHHAEIFNIYNRVEITLTTHDADGISMRDVEMAGDLDNGARGEN